MWRTFLTEQRDFVHGVGVLEDVIDEVRVPSVVLADPADTLIPVATAYALQSRLPASELQLVTFGGHNLHRRNPEAPARSSTSPQHCPEPRWHRAAEPGAVGPGQPVIHVDAVGCDAERREGVAPL